MSQSKDDSGRKSYDGYKVKILSLLSAHAWVEFLEGPLQGTGCVRLAHAQLDTAGGVTAAANYNYANSAVVLVAAPTALTWRAPLSPVTVDTLSAHA